MACEHELEVALAAADAAGRALRELYSQFVAIPDAPANISTDADRKSQEIILGHLRQHFPSDAPRRGGHHDIGPAQHTGTRLWVVDPIDGTRGFARKNGEFSIMIAFVENGEIGTGVVLEPAQDRLTYAARGRGCWRRDGADSQPVQCQVRKTASLAAATLTQSRSRDPAKVTPPVQALQPARIIETYSAGIKLALVARGEADLYVNTYEAFHDWDICAGNILVQEAGGVVTGLAGQQLYYGLPGAWQKHGLLASNGLLHAAAIEGLKSMSPSGARETIDERAVYPAGTNPAADPGPASLSPRLPVQHLHVCLCDIRASNDADDALLSS